MNQTKMEIHSKFVVGTSFVNPKIGKEMEVCGNKYENNESLFLVAELSWLFEPGYNGVWVKANDLDCKLDKKEIKITKDPLAK
ncbi:MAG: hypothetical protein UT21_C0006G0029 [Candidatus Woesebacteria bacterium GW2011_GWA1_39_11b]|nr:MAG: hypothetical protein UT21_C0006G0029 [Candidatus Woesebacteria bacterium GW2011_GWA1_39_11b]KKS77107.1 MAG: hypothetical protein UV51_C0010G0012 [Candidatus Woesebacteria bacterium GW2011_GWC1_42_9]